MLDDRVKTKRTELRLKDTELRLEDTELRLEDTGVEVIGHVDARGQRNETKEQGCEFRSNERLS